MGDPVHRDGKNARVAENDLIKTFSGRIAFIRRIDVGGQSLSKQRHFFEELQRHLVSPIRTVAARQVVPEAIMPNAQGDLFREEIEQNGDCTAHAVFQGDRI